MAIAACAATPSRMRSARSLKTEMDPENETVG
jgi:hypothetical protein